jgi:uncharacterized damage-inducible protein DinB
VSSHFRSGAPCETSGRTSHIPTRHNDEGPLDQWVYPWPILVNFNRMAPQEMKDVSGQLEHARAELIVVVTGLTEEQARTRPAPERWSVLECLEHVCFVERRFLGMIKASEPGTPAERDAAKEAALVERVVDRSNRRTAPEAVRPAGKYGSLSEALQDFNAARDETLRFASEQGANLLTRSANHAALGPLNGVEALLLIANHGRRHTAQMQEAATGR